MGEFVGGDYVSELAVEIRNDIAAMIRPKDRVSVVESSERHVNVRTASGGRQKWDKSLTPYMIEPMNCLNSRLYDAVIFIGPAQSGKTQGLITNFMAYIIKYDPSDSLIMQTTKGTARDFDTQVIKRAFRDSPDLKDELAPGSKSDNTYDKVFKSGAILFQRWPSINEISGKPLKYVMMTDYDRMSQDIDGEGSPFSLGQQRTAKFLSRGMTVVDTSPGFEITDPNYKLRHKHEAPPCGGGLSLFNMGDMRRWYVECPECGEYFMPPPDESGLKFDHDRDLFGATISEITREIKYVCTANGCLIDLKLKRQMNQTGIWVPDGCFIENGELRGDRINTRIATFWFPGIFAAYSDQTSIVAKYLNGYREYDITGSEQNLKTVINVNFGSPYLPRHLAELKQEGGLSSRLEELPRYYVPEQARVLFASVDIQNGKTGRFVVKVHAVGKYLEQWPVDRFEIAFNENDGIKRRVEPGVYQEDWDLLLDRVINASYKTHSGRKMMIHLTAIDSGGLGRTTDYSYQFYRKLRRFGLASKVILIKGGSSDNKSPITPSFGKDSRGNPMKDVPISLLNSDSFKEMVNSMLDRTLPDGMMMHFPHWYEENWYDELRAEIRGEGGKWKKLRERNEELDLCCYILACCWFLGMNSERFDWDKHMWCAPIESNSNVVDIDTARVLREVKPAKKQKQKRSSYLL